jgi:predicted Fe-Mo cluster-binding NifX family protein
MKAMQHYLAVVEILQGNIYRIRTIENNSKALQLSQGLLLKKSNNH